MRGNCFCFDIKETCIVKPTAGVNEHVQPLTQGQPYLLPDDRIYLRVVEELEVKELPANKICNNILT